MTIRIVCQEIDTCPGGEVTGRRLRTFDIEAPALEEYMLKEGQKNDYIERSVIGAEICP
jgi:hypothetical protein